MRKAIDRLLKESIVHDLGESAAQAGIIATIQAANGVDPEDIALTSALGFGVGASIRPLAAMGGAAVGRRLDKTIAKPTEFDSQGRERFSKHIYNDVMKFIPSTTHNVAMIDRALNDSYVPEGLKAILRGAQPLNKSRMNAYYTQGGKGRGFYEGDVSVVSRFFGDNIAQLGTQLAIPAIIGAESINEQ